MGSWMAFLDGWIDYDGPWVHETSVLHCQVTEASRVIRDPRAMVWPATLETKDPKVTPSSPCPIITTDNLKDSS